MKRIGAISITVGLIAVLSFSGTPNAQPNSEAEAKAAKVTLKSVAAQVSALQGTLGSLQTTVSSLQGQVSSQGSALGAQISSLQGTVTSLQTTVTSAQSQLSSPGAQNAFALGKFMIADSNGNIGVGTTTPERFFSLAGDLPRNLGMDSNPGGAGNSLLINAGASAEGSADLQGGDLVLAAGTGTGLGGSGNARIQTAGAEDLSGTTDNTLTDRK